MNLALFSEFQMLSVERRTVSRNVISTGGSARFVVYDRVDMGEI